MGFQNRKAVHYFMGRPTVALTRRGTFKCRRVIAQEYMEVPPRTQTDVIARVTLRKAHERFPTDVVVEASQLKRGLYVGRTLLPQRHRDVRVCGRIPMSVFRRLISYARVTR